MSERKKYGALKKAAEIVNAWDGQSKIELVRLIKVEIERAHFDGFYEGVEAFSDLGEKQAGRALLSEQTP